MERQLRRSQKLESIGTMAGGIAHDFNNILTPIMGYAEMGINALASSHPVYDDLRHIYTGATRAKDLVEQILLFSKQTEKEREPLDMKIILQETLKLVKPSIPKNIEIKQLVDISEGRVMADSVQMHQVIVNLCTNAWQAMEETGGILTIELSNTEPSSTEIEMNPKLKAIEYVLLSVGDTGYGMDDETLERIFEPFFTTKPVSKGTGLGLSVVHGIIQSHGGEILVNSIPGKGSVFRVYLPENKSLDRPEVEKLPDFSYGKEKVMIVDDEKAILGMMQKMLTGFDYRVEIYHDGNDALKAFKTDPDSYDLVITDFSMPNITGLNLAEQIHNLSKKVPVMIMTGYGDDFDKESQKKYGIKYIFRKPLTMQVLVTEIRKVLDN